MVMEGWEVGLGGGDGVGLGLGGGVGLGGGGWSIAGRRGGMLLCRLSFDSETKSFEFLLVYLKSFLPFGCCMYWILYFVCLFEVLMCCTRVSSLKLLLECVFLWLGGGARSGFVTKQIR